MPKIPERCIEHIAAQTGMLTRDDICTACKLSRSQWQRIYDTPGRPDPVRDGHFSLYHPDTMALHLRRCNEIHAAQTLRQLSATLNVTRKSLERMTTHPAHPKSKGMRFGLPTFDVEEMRAFREQLLRGFKRVQGNGKSKRKRRTPNGARKRKDTDAGETTD